MRIEARGLSAGYGRRSVLAEIDLCLEGGELVGLIGPNGAGKSTLLRALSGVLQPSAGDVCLADRPLSAFPAKERARHIAFVPQSEPALFDFMVREVVLMGRYAHRSGLRSENAEDYEEAARAMSATDTLHLADRPITALSGGEHRRALLARALAQRAPFMLLDEPTAHLDITHQSELLTLLHRLTRTEGLGAIAALHDVNLAADFCDRLLLLSNGTMVAGGAPAEVLTSGLLSRAYGGDLQVIRNPATGRPMLLSPGPDSSLDRPSLRIHVICGGGSGLETLSALHRRGYSLSAGVLNRLDSDEQAAAVLSIPVAVEAPFSPIGPVSRAAGEEMARAADVLVVTPVPLGRGNLGNLQIAEQALLERKPVFLLGGSPGSRDFTGGEGAALWGRLIEGGATHVDSLADLETRLSALEPRGQEHA